MFPFYDFFISAVKIVFEALIKSIIERKKENHGDYLKDMVILLLPILLLCILASPIDGNFCVEVDVKNFVPNDDRFYSDISYGPCVRIGSKVYVGGQYVNVSSGEGGYFYKLQTTEP